MSGSMRGFTLIELLLVVALVGLFASTVLTNLQAARERAVTARIEVEFKELERAMFVAQTQARLPLISITGSNCSDCSCRTGMSVKDLPDTDVCVARWLTALSRITTATAGVGGDLSRFERDPWGAPYLLDENENEVPTNPCRADTLRSAGPNNIVGDSDDIRVDLRFYNTSCGS